MSTRFSTAFRRYVLHPMEAAIAYLAYYGMKMLPIDAASGLGGWLGRIVGPRLRLSERAHRNLSRAYPDMTAEARAGIVADMWEHLGRVAAEFPHLSSLRIHEGGNRIEVLNGGILDRIRESGRPAIFFSGHIGNWELLPHVIIQRRVPMDFVYRAANNRMVEWLYRSARKPTGGGLIPKGSHGARMLIKTLREGRSIGMLVDQKMNDGVPVPFFGRDAMTATALAELALRYDCPIVGIRAERLAGARFRITFFGPFDMPRTGDRSADVKTTMTLVNATLEGWIRDRPEQWLWLHNRWPD